MPRVDCRVQDRRVDETIAAIQVGYRHFAENRPQELVRKLAGLADHPELPRCAST